MSRILVDNAALVAEFNRQGGPALLAKAEQAVKNAKAEGPRNPRHHRHIVDQLGVGAPVFIGNTIAVPITSTSPFWHFLEFGTAQQTPSRPVSRGAQNAGLRVIG